MSASIRTANEMNRILADDIKSRIMEHNAAAGPRTAYVYTHTHSRGFTPEEHAQYDKHIDIYLENLVELLAFSKVTVYPVASLKQSAIVVHAPWNLIGLKQFCKDMLGQLGPHLVSVSKPSGHVTTVLDASLCEPLTFGEWRSAICDCTDYYATCVATLADHGDIGITVGFARNYN